jgi:hypothetical protein
METPFDQLRRLTDLVEALLLESGRSATLEAGSLVQIRGHGNFWPGSLLRVTRVLPNGDITGVHLLDHRAGALEGKIRYRPDEVEFIGRVAAKMDLAQAAQAIQRERSLLFQQPSKKPQAKAARIRERRKTA